MAQTESHPTTLPFDGVIEPLTERSWHPKVTAYRLTFTAVTLGLGTSKALLSATKGCGSAVSTTIEWISGIVVLLVRVPFSNRLLYLFPNDAGSSFFLSQYEANDKAIPHWFFKADIVDAVRNFFRQHPRLRIRIPQYDTEERELESEPQLTGYRILVMGNALSFGLAKAMLSYYGLETAPTTLEWIYGVVITIFLYWLGFYESSTHKFMPWLFSSDYSHQVIISGQTLFILAFLLTVLAGATWWTTTWSHSVIDTFKTGWDHSTLDSGPASPRVDLFFNRILTFTLWLLLPAGLCAAGVFVGVMVLYGMWEALVNFVQELDLVSFARTIATRVLRHFRTRTRDEATPTNVVQSRFTKLTQPIRSFFKDRFTSDRLRSLVYILSVPILFPLIGLLYILAHTILLMVTVGWTSWWLYQIIRLWTSAGSATTSSLESPPSWVKRVLVGMVGTILTPLLAIPVGLGLRGIISVLASLLFTPLVFKVVA